MIAWLFAWLWYLVPTGVASYAAVHVYAKYDNMAFALVTGMLAGTALSLLLGSIYWENTNVCEFCLTGEN